MGWVRLFWSGHLKDIRMDPGR